VEGFIMSWRWRKSISLGGGTRTSMTSRGMGVSWGIAGFRVGRAPTGSLWVSFTIPGTGISFFKKLTRQSQQAVQQQPLTRPQSPVTLSLPNSSIVTKTPNQRVLDEIRQFKP
jgi:hypothetical protein